MPSLCLLRAGAAIAGIALVAGCTTPTAPRGLTPEVRAAMSEPAATKPSALPPAVAQALVPPPDLRVPPLTPQVVEPRFDLNVVNLPAAQVFAALAKDTRYSMLVDGALTTPVTVNLKDVTLVEALETLREMYGFEYRVQGTRVFVHPASLQTRVFQVNYLIGNRAGRSDVRITSGSIANADAERPGGSRTAPIPGSPAPGAGAPQESSRITTETRNDLWNELQASLRLLIGFDAAKPDGRQLVVSPQSGVIVVRALPRELRAVEEYLQATRLNVERQVMLEAKIVDVRLSNGYQTGINWAGFVSGANHRGGAGMLTPGSSLGTSGNLIGNGLTATPGSALELAGTAPSGLFGLAFQTSNFAALIKFLETQGDVQVLSSPRIAALNNQKAVLKVGSDDFFVTGITTNINAAATAGGTTVVSPTITVQPFFSGIALDVTPQIDADGNIILHIHPSVSSVAERTKVLDLGSAGGVISLPLASSSVSETDTIVRVRDGSIVAIGGLMKAARSFDRAQLPGLGDVPVAGHLLGSTERTSEKSELVILIKPTVIHSDRQLEALREESLQRLQSLAGEGAKSQAEPRW